MWPGGGGRRGLCCGLFTPNRSRNLSPSIPELLLNQKRHFLLFLPRTGPTAQPALPAAVPRAEKSREIPRSLLPGWDQGFTCPWQLTPSSAAAPLPCTHTSVPRHACEFVCEFVRDRVAGNAAGVARTRAHTCVRVSTGTCTHACANVTPVQTHVSRAHAPAVPLGGCGWVWGYTQLWGDAWRSRGAGGLEGYRQIWGCSSSWGCSTCGVQAVLGGDAGVQGDTGSAGRCSRPGGCREIRRVQISGGMGGVWGDRQIRWCLQPAPPSANRGGGAPSGLSLRR